MCNIGISRSDEEVIYMTGLLRHYDILAIQKISTKLSGLQAIVNLNEQLIRRSGQKWDYAISDPGSGSGSERYAYIWKTSRVKLSSRPWLVGAKSPDEKIDCEPYMVRFKIGHRTALLANFHAVPISKKPDKEVVLLDQIHGIYYKDHLMIMGDFNISERSSAFSNLKRRNYEPVLTNQKTSLWMRKKKRRILGTRV